MRHSSVKLMAGVSFFIVLVHSFWNRSWLWLPVTACLDFKQWFRKIKKMGSFSDLTSSIQFFDGKSKPRKRNGRRRSRISSVDSFWGGGGSGKRGMPFRQWACGFRFRFERRRWFLNSRLRVIPVSDFRFFKKHSLSMPACLPSTARHRAGFNGLLPTIESRRNKCRNPGAHL